jgi:hypothetical protein
MSVPNRVENIGYIDVMADKNPAATPGRLLLDS